MSLGLLTSGFLKITFHSLLIITIFSGCIKQENCPRYVQIPANLFPAQIEYHIGDTITIMSKFHREVLAFNSELKEIGTVDLVDINWTPSTSIMRTDTMGQGGIVIFHKYFSFVENEKYDYHMFIASDNFSALDGKYNFENDTFDLQIKIIPNKIGTFFLGQETGTGFNGEQKFPGRCPGLNVEAWVNMNNGDDNNIELFEESPDPFWNDQFLNNPTENFYRNGGYSFRVIP